LITLFINGCSKVGKVAKLAVGLAATNTSMVILRLSHPKRD